jgi:hypothetical protein
MVFSEALRFLWIIENEGVAGVAVASPPLAIPDNETGV